MIDYYLSTADEATMHTVLAQTGLTDEEGNPRPGIDLDVLGIQHQRTGGTDEEPIFTPVEGWHFNVRAREPIAWVGEVVQHTPATPWRKWA